MGDDTARFFAALDAAYAKASAAHDAGACGESEWSCSYCEDETDAES